jgi:hypothetical protein
MVGQRDIDLLHQAVLAALAVRNSDLLGMDTNDPNKLNYRLEPLKHLGFSTSWS